MLFSKGELTFGGGRSLLEADFSRWGGGMSKFSTLPPIPPSRENPALTVNLIFLANKPTPDPIIQHLKESIISGCLLNWNTDFTKINLPRCSKCTGLYANKAQKIKSAYHCTYRQVSDLKVLLLK